MTKRGRRRFHLCGRGGTGFRACIGIYFRFAGSKIANHFHPIFIQRSDIQRVISIEPFDQDDLQNAILCVWKGARGDGCEAMNAVAHVIFNRVGFPGPRHDVIYGKNQFSSMSISTDPQYRLPTPSMTDPEYPSYLHAANIVKAIAAGTNSDPTNGALYYANLEESTSGWFFRHIVEHPLNHPVRATIGHRVFYA